MMIVFPKKINFVTNYRLDLFFWEKLEATSFIKDQ